MAVVDFSDTSEFSTLRKMDSESYEDLKKMTESQQHWDAHMKYYQLCKEVKALTSPVGDFGGDLAEKKVGFYRNILSARTVDKIRGFIDEGLSPAQTELRQAMELMDKSHSEYFEQENFHKNVPLTRKHIPAMQSVIEEMFSSELVDSLESALKCNFYISHLMFCRTFPTDRPTGSFAWHRDMTSATQLHLMCYLTDSLEDGSGGITEFLPAAETRDLASKTGYHYKGLAQRTNDIVSLGGSAIQDRVIRPHLRPGDAAAFLASLVLHRGVPPKHKPRDAFLIILRPSLLNWKEMLEEFGVEKMIGRGFGYQSLTVHPANP